MFGPNYGAVGLTLAATRLMQVICLITGIGLTSNFISEIVTAEATASSELIGTLAVMCIGTVYCFIGIILYIDEMLPFLMTAIVDFHLLVALVVVSVVLGRPLTYLNCEAIGDPAAGTSAYDFTAALGSSVTITNGVVDYTSLAGASKPNCLEMKSIWGLSIALTVLFAFSCTCSTLLWKRKPLTIAKALAGGA